MYLKFRKPGKKIATKGIDPDGTPFEEVTEEKSEESAHQKRKHPIELDDTQIEEITKIVINRIMPKIQPLLDKLAEIIEQQKKEPETSKENTLADQLTKLQETAKERMAIQEQRVAAKLGKVQARMNKPR